MLDLDQDVNQNGQTQPLQDTSSEGISEDSTQVVQGDVNNTDPVDDKGVSYKNRFMEERRKREAAEIRLQERERFLEIQQRYQPPPQPQTPPSPPQPQITDEQLWEMVQNSPEHATLARQELQRRERDRIKTEVLSEVQTNSSKQYWEQKAMQDFPELNNQGGAFWNEVAKEYRYLNPNLPEVVYLAAKNATTRIKGTAQIIPNRGQNLSEHVVGTNASVPNKSREEEFKLSTSAKMIANQFGIDEKGLKDVVARRKAFAKQINSNKGEL